MRNRIIKFRAWDTKEKYMYECPTIQLCCHPDGTHTYTTMAFGQRRILMQYTGLKDKNGVEIYEGDIIRFAEFKPDLERLPWKWMMDEKGKGYEVIFELGYFGFKREKGSGSNNLYSHQIEYSEVIGNIYQNNNLIK